MQKKNGKKHISKWIFHKENGGTDMEFTEMDEVHGVIVYPDEIDE